MIKNCRVCGIEINAVGNQKDCVDCRGVLYKEYQRNFGIQYREENKEKSYEYHKDWRERNREHLKEYWKAYRENNYVKISYYERVYKSNNLDKHREYQKWRREKIKEATPKWAKLEYINLFKKLAKIESYRTRLEVTVDHIIPIVSDLVCGLHCEDNLQLLTKEDNCKKGSRFARDGGCRYF